MKQAIIIFAHGSPVEAANEAIRAVAGEVASTTGCETVAAFLERGSPDLKGAMGQLGARGATRVVVVPYFLTLGLHLQRDLPSLVQEARSAHDTMEIEVTPPLDGHPLLAGIAADRARAALKEGNKR